MCLVSWSQIKKMIILKCCLILFYATTLNHFSIGLWLALKVDLDNNQRWLAQRLNKEAPKHFPKTNLYQKKVMVTVWWSTADLIHYSFWIPVKPLHLRSMLSKLMRRTKNCNACRRHWVNRVGPILLQNNAWGHVAQ